MSSKDAAASGAGGLPSSRKVLTLREAQNLCPGWGNWVLTNGVFDILHRGHVNYLERARSYGERLVVAVNSDASVKRLGKGAERPFNTLEDRMAVLAALAAVDFVLPFEEDSAVAVVRALSPPNYVKGGDYDLRHTPEGQAVAAYGGRCYEIAFEFERSTTALAKKIRQ